MIILQMAAAICSAAVGQVVSSGEEVGMVTLEDFVPAEITVRISG
jgi:hypothetical protein